MDRACENCRFCIYAHSMRGKEEPYCKRHSKWIVNTILCSEWEMVSVPKPQTNADRIRAMTDEELAEFINDVWDRLLFGNDLPGMCDVCYTDTIQNCKKCWLDWLRQEVSTDG